MSNLVVDASVWVAAADATDPFAVPSRAFLAAVAERAVPVAVPALARPEIACALARRLRDSEAGRTLGTTALAAVGAETHSADDTLIAEAVALGTDGFLRAGDAVYAALAMRLGAVLVAWDDDLVARAQAVTPATWLEKWSA